MISYENEGLRSLDPQSRRITFRSVLTAVFSYGIALSVLICTPSLSSGQSYTNDAASREISIFNFGSSGASIEAISREVTIFNRGTYSLDAISREVSVFNYGFNHLNLIVGSTVVPAGTSGSIPVTVSTLAPLTSVQATVDFPGTLLTNWAVLPQ